MRQQPLEAVRARLTRPEAYDAAQLVNVEFESHLNIGLVKMAQGKAAAAQKAYRTALRLDPGFVPAYVNLADLYRALGSDAEGEETLRAGLAVVPDSADLHHALGLLEIRAKRLDEAVTALRRADELAPENSRYAYVHALVLNETGNAEAALRVLADAHRRYPADVDLPGHPNDHQPGHGQPGGCPRLRADTEPPHAWRPGGRRAAAPALTRALAAR